MANARMRQVGVRVGACILGVALLASVPASAYADLWIEKKGGIGATYKTSYGAQTGAYVEDVAADSHAVRIDYYRYSTANPMLTLRDTDGSKDGTYNFDERRGKVVTLKLCVYNSNPFDWQWCSGWIS
ncbi:hypothetical protein [Cellulomonas uda]|uniref:hypothetical protein n=1 Tax=Cellulomonas uda TaxID=1714 RepID=UPI001141C80E|nr:hypothetical protein [Cellulomonas uda]